MWLDVLLMVDGGRTLGNANVTCVSPEHITNCHSRTHTCAPNRSRFSHTVLILSAQNNLSPPPLPPSFVTALNIWVSEFTGQASSAQDPNPSEQSTFLTAGAVDLYADRHEHCDFICARETAWKCAPVGMLERLEIEAMTALQISAAG